MKPLDRIISKLNYQAGWGQYTGGDVSQLYLDISELKQLNILLSDLSKSYEYYSACNKPEVEWDEYDYMMYSIWKRLHKLLEDEDGTSIS